MKSFLQKSNIKLKNKPIFVFVFLMLSLMVVFNLNIENIHAESGTCNAVLDQGLTLDGSELKTNLIYEKTTSSKEECTAKCEEEKSKLSDSQKEYWKDDTCQFKSDSEEKEEQKKKNDNIAKAAGIEKTKSTCDGISFWDPWTIVNCLLLYILKFVGLLLNLAIIIFKKMIDTDALKTIMNNDTIYKVWQVVRDMLNVLFIMTLLFSAFATVFQIDKYNYRKILLNLVIMALLVNFSYPITRFIIDVSNVIMYFFVNTLLNSGTTTGEGAILNYSGIGDIVGNAKVGDSTLYLISAIVFLFILAITILIIGVLLLIRVVALTILIIFSPIGYVGTIIPGSDLAKAAHQWWSSLMNYSFFGPIMVFLIYVAIKMMEATKGFDFADKSLSSNSDVSAFAAKAALACIPIVILWMGILSAKKSSTFGAAAVVNTGMKWGGAIAKSPLTKTGIAGTAKKRWEKFGKTGPLFGSDAVEKREAWLQSKILPKSGYGNKNALRDLDRKKVNEKRKEWKDNGGASAEDIQNGLQSKLAHERKAAALEAAENNGFGQRDAHGNIIHGTDIAQYRAALSAVADDPVYQQLFNSKVEKKHIRLVIENEGGTPAAFDKHLTGLTSEALSKQEGLHENINTAAGAGFRDYVARKVQPDAEYHKELFKKLTKDQRTQYTAAGLNP